MDYLLLGVGIILGVIIGLLIERLRNSTKTTASISPVELQRKYVLRELLEQREQQLNELEKKTNLRQEELLDLTARLASQTQLIEQLQEDAGQREASLLQVQNQMKLEFENLSNRLLEEKSKRFTAQNQSQLESMLGPLQEKIKAFEQKVALFYNEDSKDRAALGEQLRQLGELNRMMSDEARNLTKALKGESKVQGNWGEMILERILEHSGLMNGREYKIQKAYRSEDGRRLQPDLIVFLPHNRQLVIDAKVSLTAYERYCSAEDFSEQQTYLKEHLLSIKRHVKELSKKKYQQLYELNSLDYVLMFIPIEPAFAVAMEEGHQFFYDALEQNILLVSPTTLLATLRTIANIWRQEQQSKNAKEIARQGGLLFDRLLSWVEELELLGQRMQTANNSYQGLMQKLRYGQNNLIQRSKKLQELGAKVSKTIPEKYLEEDSSDQQLS